MAAEWDRLPDESEPAFKAFCAYRDMGPDRVALEAYRTYCGRTTPVHLPRHWQEWMPRHRWRTRCLAYDHYKAEVERRGAERAIEKDAERWGALRTKWLDDSIRRAQKLGEKCDTLLAFPVTETTALVEGKPAVISPIGTLELQRAARCAIMAHELAFACIAEALPKPDVAWDPNSTEAEEVERLLAAAGLRIVPLDGAEPARHTA